MSGRYAARTAATRCARLRAAVRTTEPQRRQRGHGRTQRGRVRRRKCHEVEPAQRELLATRADVAEVDGDLEAANMDWLRERQDAETIANKIIDALNAPFLIEGHELFVSGSLGIAIYPEAGESMESLR